MNKLFSAIIVSTSLIVGHINMVSAAPKIERSSSTHSAGDTVRTTSTVSTPVSRDVSIGVTSTNTFDKPGRGADGPIPGNQRGSNNSTSVGPTIIYRF